MNGYKAVETLVGMPQYLVSPTIDGTIAAGPNGLTMPGFSMAGPLDFNGQDLRNSADFILEPSSYADSVEIGRGDTDTDITYIRLKNAGGTDVYIYPNATGDGVSVSTSKP